MALPKEPRQKMINIMYLVLTAMLAINISAEILNAFKTINNSLEKTNVAVNASTEQVFQSLTEKMDQNETRVKASIWQPIAQNVISESKTVYDFIAGLKEQLLTEAGGDPNDPEKKFKEDDQNLVTRIMVNEGKGKQLYQMLQSYKANVLKDSALSAAFANNFSLDLDRPDSKNSNKKSWEEDYFYMAPTVGALSILSKFQNDIRTAENRMVTYCHEQVGQVILRFDSFEAIVGQNSKYLMPGQEIEITAGLGAFSKSKLPTVTINGANVPVNEKGMALYKAPVKGVGSHSINVNVAFIDQDGNPQTRPFTVEYVVGSANASIALDKMNVLYTGVDNPVTIAASGGGDDRVVPTINGGGGTLRRLGNGKYIAKVSQQTDDCTITVTVDGKVAGASSFRVRSLPDPTATVAAIKSGGSISAAEFKAQNGVSAALIGFPFDIKFWVTSFTFETFDNDGFLVQANCTGNTYNNQARDLINRFVKKDNIVYITNIRATGEDGVSRTLPSIQYTIR